jgi:hypothetical protein
MGVAHGAAANWENGAAMPGQRSRERVMAFLAHAI